MNLRDYAAMIKELRALVGRAHCADMLKALHLGFDSTELVFPTLPEAVQAQAGLALLGFSSTSESGRVLKVRLHNE